MNVTLIGSPEIIMSNPDGKHKYFAWPTVTRLQNGKLAAVASGFRLRHVCPFGKTVISYSENEGKTWTAPCPVFDTPLDDRDGGILAFGESGVIVTSFNNTTKYQREHEGACDYSLAYLDTVTKEEEERYLGSLFRVSFDCGVTFGPIYKSPITSPHGPLEMGDGSILWVGKDYNNSVDAILAYTLDPVSGKMEHIGTIPPCEPDADGLVPVPCEPHSIILDDGTLITHIRMEGVSGKFKYFSTYQSVSTDGGRTWSVPVPLLDRFGGSPAHLFMTSEGILISTYTQRKSPCGIKAMFSLDNGKTWDTGYDLYVNDCMWDLGYSSTVELKNGNLLTVFYAHVNSNEPAVIMQQEWSVEK